MNEVSNTSAGGLATLDSLAVQAQMFVQSARMNLLQLGRVLTEAKPLVPHGEWENWIRVNTNMSKRAAQQYMQAYAKFGLDPQIAQLGTTKTLKLLPLSEEEREELFQENDVAAMSTRELDEAIQKQKDKLIKEVREQVQGEIDQAKLEKEEAQKKGQELLDKIRAMQSDSRVSEKAYKDLYEKSNTEKEKLVQEKRRLEQDIRERDEIIEEQQADYDRAQEELLNVKSSIAKGDAERVPLDQLTPDAFGSAVRSFIGTCARMPHMAATFSGMSDNDKQEYDELLRTIESLAAGSRKALDSAIIEGEVI